VQFSLGQGVEPIVHFLNSHQVQWRHSTGHG
jgi:hypothetical protein